MTTISDYFRSGYPIIWLQSSDYEGAQEHIRAEIQKGVRSSKSATVKRTQFAVWKRTTGLKVFQLEPPAQEDGEEEPVDEIKNTFTKILTDLAEKSMEDPDTATPVVAVFHNVEFEMSNPMDIQTIIDASLDLQRSHSMLVLLGPVLSIPIELQNIIVHCPYPIPAKDEMLNILMDQVVFAHAENIENIIVPKVNKDRKPKQYRKELIELNRDLLEEVAASACGLEPVAATNAFGLSITSTKRLEPHIVRDQKKTAISRSEGLQYFHLEETMEDVGGFEAYKIWLAKRARAFSKEAQDFGIAKPKGVLFVGNSGTGKSLAAKATSSTLGIPLVRFDISKLFGSYVGESEDRMNRALETVEAISPVTLWCDEVEKGFAGGRSGEMNSGVTSRLIGMLLQWRQETNAPVFLVSTCNDIQGIPPEFYRPGRVDALFVTTLPLEREREEIFRIHLRKRNRRHEDYKCDLLAAKAKDFSGAEIELSIQEALLSAFTQGRELANEDILDAITEILPHRMAIRRADVIEEMNKWLEDWGRPVSLPEKNQARGAIRSLA